MRRGSSRHVSRRPARSARPRRGTGSTVLKIDTFGEFELIDRLTRILGRTAPPSPEGPGDDAAVLRTTSRTLVTTDVLEEDVHFRRGWMLPEELGSRAIEVNVSDIAAMGGAPKSALISLVLPPELPLAVLDGIYRGVVRSAKRAGLLVVGGNISKSGSSRLSIAVTLIGRPVGRKPVLRSGGRPGDLIIVSGSPGLAGLGYRLLKKEADSFDDWMLKAPAWRQRLAAQSPVGRAALRRFLAPEARVDLGIAAARSGATAMIDISDGLSADLAHLAEASNCGAAIDAGALPFMRGMEAFCETHEWSAVDLVLTGGEDYELLFTISAKNWSRFQKKHLGARCAVIGRLTKPDEGLTTTVAGTANRLRVKGYRHF